MRTVEQFKAIGFWVHDHRFEHAGDSLDTHQHATPDLNHLTIITKGSFVLTGRQAGRTVSAGDVIAWEIDEEHGLTAIADDSACVNVRRLP